MDGRFYDGWSCWTFVRNAELTMINNEDAFWKWFKKKTNSSAFTLKQLDEGYVWEAKNGSGYWEESDSYFDTPYECIVDFFSNLICCEVVDKD